MKKLARRIDQIERRAPNENPPADADADAEVAQLADLLAGVDNAPGGFPAWLAVQFGAGLLAFDVAGRLTPGAVCWARDDWQAWSLLARSLRAFEDRNGRIILPATLADFDAALAAIDAGLVELQPARGLVLRAPDVTLASVLEPACLAVYIYQQRTRAPWPATLPTYRRALIALRALALDNLP